MWPGLPLRFSKLGVAGRSSIEALGAHVTLWAGCPGTTTEDRPLAFGAGGYGMSVFNRYSVVFASGPARR